MTELTLALPEPAELSQRLTLLPLDVAADLERRHAQLLARRGAGQPVDRLISRWLQLEAQGLALIEARRAARPAQIELPPELPITAAAERIEALLLKHQVIVLAGETGSGKTTQIPKFCLRVGRGLTGQIGHTQPRRIAATSVAARIAAELGQPLGQTVGYQVRFADQAPPTASIKLMTDGILLAELQHDPNLLRYDTLIIDEAHERSLNIDFLLGYLKQLLPKRPDLKVIITSATIDVEKFSAHFDGAPVVEVSGRTYPVEIRYRPPSDPDADLTQQVVDALAEVMALPARNAPDVLVFLPGERDIREVALAVRRAEFPHLDVLPLYARLSLAEQAKVFAPHRGRRVVLATNVAETSITVPGIGFVIDPGIARISRYSLRTQMQRLPIEPVSQASAAQRAGRCGRVQAGVCLRLYAEEDFANRPAFTDPEILRTNLAAVILQMLASGIRDVERFPFVDPPESKAVRDGFKLLEELAAVDSRGHMTAAGRQMASLPVDPRLARMLLDAHKAGALAEMLIIACAMALPDPRERPQDKQQAADEKHRRFWHEQSDFLSYVALWQYAESEREALSQNQFKKLCQKEFLNYLRLREWRELHRQLKLAMAGIGLKDNAASSLKENNEPAAYEAVHRALLAGLLSNIGRRLDEPQEYDYAGTRGRKFSIFPGSSQAKKKPQWLLAGEVIETSRVFAHQVAKIEPQWVEQVGRHLLKYHYYEPHYASQTGQVMCYARITLFGLVLAEKKLVGYSRVDAADARRIFIREALVEGGYSRGRKRGQGEFFAHNLATVAAVQTLEDKARRRDILVDDEVIFAFYDGRVPQDVTNLAGFEHFRKRVEFDDPAALHIPIDLLMRRDPAEVAGGAFPDSLDAGGQVWPLHYHFEPGHADDGVSLDVPAGALHSVRAARLTWLVPGLLEDKIAALLRKMPKQTRKRFVPVPEYAARARARLSPGDTPLAEALARELLRLAGPKEIPADALGETELEPFYRMNVRVLDSAGKVIDRGRDLAELQRRYRAEVQVNLARAGASLERDQLSRWDFGGLAAEVTLERRGIKVPAFPALVEEPAGVALRLLDSPVDARAQTRRGLAALAARRLGETVRYLQKELLRNRVLGLAVVDLGKREDVVRDLIEAALFDSCFAGEPLPRDEQTFEARLARGRPQLVARAQSLERALLGWLTQVVAIKQQLKGGAAALALAWAAADINAQLAALFYKGFLFETPAEWLDQYGRYLKAIEQRLEKAPQNAQKDRVNAAQVADFWQRHETRLAAQGKPLYLCSPEWQHYRYLIEELRVSLFAQQLGTKVPVSAPRLEKAWQSVLAESPVLGSL